jgi:hypothetical protein
MAQQKCHDATGSNVTAYWPLINSTIIIKKSSNTVETCGIIIHLSVIDAT